MNVDSDMNNVLSYIELRDSIKNYDPPIEFSAVEKQNLHQAKDFIGDARYSQLDLKEFYAMFVYKDAFDYYKQSNF